VKTLAWILVGAALFGLAVFVLLRWLALRIARQVAEATERRLTAAMARGTSDILAARTPDPARRARHLRQIDRLAWLMDRAVPMPVVGGIGLDSLLGLIPGVGDVISLLLSASIVVRAAQLGLSSRVITRLIAIQATDFLLGLLPLAGDLFDVVYKADVRSAALIHEAIDAQVTRLLPPAG
jgi:hypothetical protein